MSGETPDHLIDWKGNDWTPEDNDGPAAHPNARFTTPAAQCPCDRGGVGGPEGRADRRVPVRRPPQLSGAPLVREAFDWEHGVFLGATMASEKTAAAAGTVGELRFDPFAMLPFCGYHMADYFAALAEASASARTPSCRRSSTSTGSARTTTASSCGPASARTRACWPGSSAAATTRRRPSRRRSATCPSPSTSSSTASTSRARGRGAERGPRRGARRARPDAGAPRAVRRRAAARRSATQFEALKERLS